MKSQAKKARMITGTDAGCVRRAFLCGSDGYSGRHRRSWVLERMETLSRMFAMDVCAYAIMSNHYHLVLRVNAALAKSWTTAEVVERWRILFAGSDLVSRYYKGDAMDQASTAKALEIVECWRERLQDISWYMRALNEHIARLANAEDACTGRFWEGRFKSQALLDEQAVLTCMAYVDLNPIRANMARTPETSDFTSIQQRIGEMPAAKHTAAEEPVSNDGNPVRLCPPCPLLHFKGWKDSPTGIPFRASDYLELVDWAGRAVRRDKAGYIHADAPPIWLRLEIDVDAFLDHVGPKRGRVRSSSVVMGQPAVIQQVALPDLPDPTSWRNWWVSKIPPDSRGNLWVS